MFDIAWGELVVIGVVALIVIGPKELPGVLRAVGHWTTKVRRMASEFQGQFQEAMREAEMADLKKEVDNLNNAARDVASDFSLHFEESAKWEPKPSETKPDEGKTDNLIKPITEEPAEGAPVASAPVTPDGYAPTETNPYPVEPVSAPVASETASSAPVPEPQGSGGGHT